MTKGPKYDPFLSLFILVSHICLKSKAIDNYLFCFIDVCFDVQINKFCHYYFMYVIVNHIIFKLSLMLNYFS